MYSVNLSNSAIKQFKSLPSEVQDRIRKAIKKLQENPRHRGTEKLSTSSEIQEYRVKVGKYRIRYIIIDEKILIFVIKIGLRKNVYNDI